MKRIPYKTIWLEYPDIKKTLSEAGIAHTDMGNDGGPRFTCPAIIDPQPGSLGITGEGDNDGSVVAMADSFLIADYLDKKYPEPSLFPHGSRALQHSFLQYWGKKLISLNSIERLNVALAHNQLTPRSQEYFRRTRERRFGMKLEEVLPPGPQRDKEIEEVRQAFDEFDKLLSDTRSSAKDAQLVMKGQTIYADVVICPKKALRIAMQSGWIVGFLGLQATCMSCQWLANGL
jgi:glutathione S-transferase